MGGEGEEGGTEGLEGRKTAMVHSQSLSGGNGGLLDVAGYGVCSKVLKRYGTRPEVS